MPLPLTVMACGTAEGTQKFKVALWKKVDGGAAYVPDSTYYFKTDGTDYRCTISGLDPAAQYRDEENNTYAGAQLLTTGLELPGGYGQTPAKIWYLKKV